jgi:hypothetical protein
MKPSVIRPRAYDLRRIFVSRRPHPYVKTCRERANGTGPVRTVRLRVFYGVDGLKFQMQLVSTLKNQEITFILFTTGLMRKNW